MDNSVAVTDRSSERLRPEEVKEKLESKEYILRKKEGAQVWFKFDEVVDAATLQPQGYVRCKFCLNFMRYDSHRTGTSHLNRHKCGSKLLAKGAKERDSSPSTPLSGVGYNALPSLMLITVPNSTVNNRTANSKLQQDLLDKCVTLCCKDIRPFDLFSGEGFRDLAQCLVNIGTSGGKVDVSSILPSPSLLAARTLDIVTEIKAHILPELDEAVTDYGAGITIDLWSDEQRSYLTTTIFYVHRDWKLVKRVLSTSQFDSGSEKDGDTFKNLLVGNLYGFGLDPSTICNLVYVIKPDLLPTSALNSFRRIDCSSAIIDKLLEITFDCSFLAKHAPEIAKVLNGSVMIVSYMKQSGLIQDVPSSFIRKEEQPWRIKLELLMFVREHYDLINQTVFPQQENGESLHSIHLDMLVFLIDFLQPFKEAIEDMEDFQYPTINLVLPWYCKLLRHTQPAITDTAVMSIIKARANQAIRDTFSIHILHKVATFLWPEFKLLKMISKVEEEEVHNAIRDMICNEKNDASNEERFGGDAEQPEKKQKVTFSQWQDDKQLEDDVTNYIAMKVEMSDERDLLGWWSSKTKLFPGLSKLARSILAIPASSCSIDNGISISRKTFQDRRSTLSPDTVDAVLFLHSNLG